MRWQDSYGALKRYSNQTCQGCLANEYIGPCEKCLEEAKNKIEETAEEVVAAHKIVQRRQQFEKATDINKLMRKYWKLAGLFDDRIKAMRLIVKFKVPPEKFTKIFFKMQEAAHAKREKYGYPHTLGILENEISGEVPTCKYIAKRKILPNLDFYDSIFEIAFLNTKRKG